MYDTNATNFLTNAKMSFFFSKGAIIILSYFFSSMF